MDTTDTAVLEHVLKSTGKPTLKYDASLGSLPEVPVTCVFR